MGKVLVEFTDEELGQLIDYLTIYRTRILNMASAEACQQASMLIDKLQRRIHKRRFCTACNNR